MTMLLPNQSVSPCNHVHSTQQQQFCGGRYYCYILLICLCTCGIVADIVFFQVLTQQLSQAVLLELQVNGCQAHTGLDELPDGVIEMIFSYIAPSMEPRSGVVTTVWRDLPCVSKRWVFICCKE